MFVAPCKECGKQVFMLKMAGTSLAVAMDPYEPLRVDPYWTVTGHGYAQKGGAFVPHTCDVGIVAQFRSTWMGRIDNLQNEWNAAAYTRDCPKCGAEPGTECWNLIERRKKGLEVHTKAPHQERYPEELERGDD